VDTRPPRLHTPVLPGQPGDSALASVHQLRNPGRPSPEIAPTWFLGTKTRRSGSGS